MTLKFLLREVHKRRAVRDPVYIQHAKSIGLRHSFAGAASDEIIELYLINTRVVHPIVIYQRAERALQRYHALVFEHYLSVLACQQDKNDNAGGKSEAQVETAPA